MSRIRVLLADDHKQMLAYVRDFLSSEFQIVAAVSDGQMAVDSALELRPDVVVLDISMPILSGIEAARRLRQADPDAKIVFLTVDNDEDTRHAALETGAVGYVLKPRLRNDLISAIKLATTGGRFFSPGCELNVDP